MILLYIIYRSCYFQFRGYLNICVKNLETNNFYICCFLNKYKNHILPLWNLWQVTCCFRSEQVTFHWCTQIPLHFTYLLNVSLWNYIVSWLRTEATCYSPLNHKCLTHSMHLMNTFRRSTEFMWERKTANYLLQLWSFITEEQSVKKFFLIPA